jgi:hypothetical protein
VKVWLPSVLDLVAAKDSVTDVTVVADSQGMISGSGSLVQTLHSVCGGALKGVRGAAVGIHQSLSVLSHPVHGSGGRRTRSSQDVVQRQSRLLAEQEEVWWSFSFICLLSRHPASQSQIWDGRWCEWRV